MLNSIPLLKAMFEFSDPSEPPVFELPDCRELEKNVAATTEAACGVQ